MILAFTSSVMCRTVILLDYYANTTAYARDCVNKAKPTMHCNGKCQVMKKLEQQEKDERDNLEKSADNKTALIAGNSFYSLYAYWFTGLIPAWPRIPVQATVDKSYLLFRPPAEV